MRSRLLIVLACALSCATLAAPAASGDGSPGPGVMQSWDGLARGAVRYVAVSVGGWTAVETIRRRDGRVLSTVGVKGSWGIPLVAYDGTADGLMSDGRTLVLGQVRGPAWKQYTSFALVDVKKAKLLRILRIKGDHAFDAVSPDGRYLYLIEHVSSTDLTRYRVRAYDLNAGRLVKKPVIDKREWEETMQGAPVSRAAAPDGGWVYTLYSGSHESFIHALDTRNVQAICIDLPWKQQPKRLFEFRLWMGGDSRLVVRGPKGRALAVVDRNGHRLVKSVRNP
jgi:hypothetical protein